MATYSLIRNTHKTFLFTFNFQNFDSQQKSNYVDSYGLQRKIENISVFLEK
jgi:hypothetical protein